VVLLIVLAVMLPIIELNNPVQRQCVSCGHCIEKTAPSR
jgi:hypothetical protein